MKTSSRVLLVAAGYGAAFAAALGALAFTETQGPKDAGGMYAFGDLSFFVAVLFVASLVPSAIALWFLRSHRRLWIFLSAMALVVALSGVAAMTVYMFGRNADPHSALADWAGLSPLRMLAAPLFALAFFVSAVIAPATNPRLAFFFASILEASVAVCAGWLWLAPFHS